MLLQIQASWIPFREPITDPQLLYRICIGSSKLRFQKLIIKVFQLLSVPSLTGTVSQFFCCIVEPFLSSCYCGNTSCLLQLYVLSVVCLTSWVWGEKLTSATLLVFQWVYEFRVSQCCTFCAVVSTFVFLALLPPVKQGCFSISACADLWASLG